MNEDVVIKVEGLYKKFCTSLRRSMAYGTLDMTRNFLGMKSDQSFLRKAEFWALEDVNFEVKRGESLGIVGVNGSGKSTLLRLLSGIFPPDAGKISVKGNIGALIAVGAGFHPHMTGRENIFLNAAILGMNQEEVKGKLDDIINFAEIGEFLDAPVNTYSSGMRVRLGFSIAIHCEPDILLVDEILSVGDLSFRNKSMRYMMEYRKKANALIFVSHNLEQVLTLCSRVILLDHGKVVFDGDPDQAIIKYYEISNEIKMSNITKDSSLAINVGKFRYSGDLDIENGGILAANGEVTDNVNEGEDVNVFFDVEIKRKIDNAIFNVLIRSDLNFDIIWNNNLDKKIKYENLEPGKYRLKVSFKKPPLVPATYFLGLSLVDADSQELFLQIQNYTAFKINGGSRIPRGVMISENEWSLEKSK
jgi:lipopolysaccharide transport system ATP-binding protein